MSGAPTQKWRELVEALDLRTSEDKLTWEPTSTDDFQTRVGEATVRFGARGNDYHIWIYDVSGEIIDSFADTALDFAGQSKYYPMMRSMHQTIKRKLSGADRVLDLLIERLSA